MYNRNPFPRGHEADKDPFDENFDLLFKQASKGAKYVWLFWLVSVLVSLALSAVVIWSIVALVLHFT